MRKEQLEEEKEFKLLELSIAERLTEKKRR